MNTTKAKMGSDTSAKLDDSVTVYARTWLQHIRDTHPNVTANYDLQFHIASGSFGSVCAAIERSTGRWCAIKIIDESTLLASKSKKFATRIWRVIQEISCLRQCSRCTNIVKLWNFFEDVATYKSEDGRIIEGELRIFMVMELCELGTLQDYCAKRSFTEQQVMSIVTQMVEACSFMAEQKVVHRDIKPENILVFEDDEHGIRIKVADFGMGINFGDLMLHEFIERMPLFMDKYQNAIQEQWDKQWNQGNKVNDSCGSPLYMPPEMFTGTPYSHDADVWSLGILLYTMLFGNPPMATCRSYKELGSLMSDPELVIRYPKHDLWKTKWINALLSRTLVPSHQRCTLNYIKTALVNIRTATCPISITDDAEPIEQDKDLEALVDEYLHGHGGLNTDSSDATIPYLDPVVHPELFDWVNIKTKSQDMTSLVNLDNAKSDLPLSFENITDCRHSDSIHSLGITNDSLRSLHTTSDSQDSKPYKVTMPINGLSQFVMSQYDIRS